MGFIGMSSNFRHPKNGEKRRLESIVRRQKEERQRQSQIKQSLNSSSIQQQAKRIKFSYSDEEDDDDGACADSKQFEPSTSTGNDDPRFRMGSHFFDETKMDIVRMDENVEADENAQSGSFRAERKKRKKKNKEPKSNEKHNRQPSSKSIVDANFAEELRQKLKGSEASTASKPQQTFKFLASIGRERECPDTEKSDGRTMGENQLMAGNSQNTKETTRDDEVRISKQRRPSNSLSLYRPPNGDSAQRRCIFFIDEHNPEIRSAMASFRRHQSEETLRNEWSKQREPIVKFYKQQRKSAMRHKRKTETQNNDNKNKKSVNVNQ